MVINKGEKIHVITRRRFEGDLRRHFAGEVLETHGTTVRAEGYVFVFVSLKNSFIRRAEKRIRIFDLSDSGYIVNILPMQVRIENLVYQQSSQKHLVLSDNKTFNMEINEFGINRLKKGWVTTLYCLSECLRRHPPGKRSSTFATQSPAGWTGMTRRRSQNIPFPCRP
jgi:hypothetical protein